MTAMARRHYDLDNAPAYWDRESFPKVVTATGESVIYDLARFLEQATPISEKEFEAMCRAVLQSRP